MLVQMQLVVSNHGGRQLDGAISSIKALPSILDAVGDKIEVHIDGGIRTGQDVLKCMAMGAKGTYIGRALHLWSGGFRRARRYKNFRNSSKGIGCYNGLVRRKRHILNVSRNNLLIPKDFIPEWL